MPSRTLTISPIAADADGIATSQTPGGAGDLTLDGALVADGVATISAPAKVTITSAADDSGRTFTVYGTSRNGQSISDDVTGANASTATSTKDFATVTRIAVDAATAGAVTSGNADNMDTGWIAWDSSRSNHSGHVNLSESASMTWELQHTNANVFASDFDESNAGAVPDTTQTGKTADAMFYMAGVPVASRIAITSFVSGTLTFNWYETGS